MPKVTIRRDGISIDADLSLAEIKELIGVTGQNQPAQEIQLRVRPITEHKPPDFSAFYRELSDRGKKFIDVLMLNNQGITAEELAPKLNYNNANQIGGLTGGGVAKIARKHNIRMSDLYRSEVTFPDGKRVRMFYPGKALLRLQQKEKPAV